jgi:phosphoglycerol transferase MdoB-like AlkP superfamily enzyme
MALRLVFYIQYFSGESLSLGELASVVYWGLRMDISSVFYTNFFFIIFFLFLYPHFQKKRIREGVVLLLLLSNIPFLAINIIDLAYYRFNLRRTSSDIFQVASGAMDAFPSFWNHYWYLFMLFGILVYACAILFTRWIKKESSDEIAVKSSKKHWLQSLLFVVVLVTLARGVGNRPIMPSTSLLYLPASVQSLVNNSTITILYSLYKKQSHLTEKKYFAVQQLDSIFPVKKEYLCDSPFREKNVMLFIMESFAQDYLDDGGKWRAFTPFIDSLMEESIVCTNAFSNGTESNKGLVALLASIPPFLDEPFYASAYSNTRMEGIGSLLKQKGYSTHFMMGTEYDHFGFAKLGKTLGIDNYVTEDDYGNNKHYDGNWGIYDHFFLPFAAEKLKLARKPFFASLFNVSTHFPHAIPDSLKNRFTIKGQNVAQNSITYFDYSLRLFFDKIKNESWYRNTIFVFSADHNMGWYGGQKMSYYKFFRIPIFFHQPAYPYYQPVKRISQQVDVVPTILRLLHYQQPFLSFGNAVIDTLALGFTFNRFNGLYQLIGQNYILGYNDILDKTQYWYSYKEDSMLNNNRVEEAPFKDSIAYNQMKQYMKAVIQQHHYGLINNKLIVR